MKKILVFGAVTYDIIAHVKSLPKGNEDVEFLNRKIRIGGSGYDAAKLLNGLHSSYDLFAPYGKGSYGEYVSDKAAEEGIVLHCEREDMEGCTFHMVDEEGRQSVMVMPGAEYTFDEEDIAYEDEEDIAAILCFGDMLKGENAEEFVEFLYRCDVPVYVVSDGYGAEWNDEIWESLTDLHPCWICKEEDLVCLDEDSEKAMKKLSNENDNPLLVTTQNKSIFSLYQGERFRTPDSDGYKDNHALHYAFAAYVSARAAGVDVRNSMMFAQGLAERFTENGGVMDEYDWNEQRQRLVRMITYKS